VNLKHYMFSSVDYIQCLYYSNATYTLIQSILRAADSTFFFLLCLVILLFYFASLSEVLVTELLKRLLFIYSLVLSFKRLFRLLLTSKCIKRHIEMWCLYLKTGMPDTEKKPEILCNFIIIKNIFF